MAGLRIVFAALLTWSVALTCLAPAYGLSEQFQGRIYPTPKLKPVDSQPKIRIGDKAPDFTLPSLSGGEVTLSQFRGKKNVVISFIPAAWTPVCSEQWPGYNIVQDVFTQNDAILLGITVDNVPTLYAWTEQMGGVWFPVLSDFWPHGKVADGYGVLRSGGVSERAIFIIDKQGTVRYVDVHDINERPKIEVLVEELAKLNR
jgi:peroxiredoxin